MKVFVFVNTRIGEAASVVKALRKIPGVTSADAAIGPYDVIVQAEVANPKALSDLLLFQIQVTPGVTNTLTCLAIEV